MAGVLIDRSGVVVIPQKIRDYLKLQEGSKIDFVIDEKGDVKIVPLKLSAKSLSGMLYREGMKTVTLAEMEEAIRDGASNWA